MKDKPIQWLMGAAAVSGLVWAAGLGWTLVTYFGDAPSQNWAAQPAATAPAAVSNPASSSSAGGGAGAAGGGSAAGSQTAPKDDGAVRIVALGDSLTKGTGDPSGNGYVGYLADLLEERTRKEVGVSNLGIDGLTSDRLAASLQQSAAQAAVREADAVYISIGGNDLFRGGETLLNMDMNRIAAIRETFTRQLQGILTETRKLNAEATIYLVGLYNPFIALRDAELTSKVVRDWNHAVSETAAAFPKTVLVPTFDLFQLEVQSLLATDQFHPNAAGYRRMAERMAAVFPEVKG